jgi:hypothetical protein
VLPSWGVAIDLLHRGEGAQWRGGPVVDSPFKLTLDASRKGEQPVARWENVGFALAEARGSVQSVGDC